MLPLEAYAVNTLVPSTADAPGLPPGFPLDAPQIEHRVKEFVSSGWSTASFLGGVAVGVVVTLIAVAFAYGMLFGGSVATKKKSHEHTQEEAGDSVDAEPGMSSASASASSPGSGQKSLTEEQESMHLLLPRIMWLVGMLVIQSASSIILEGFDHLIQHHTTIFYFMTMLVGIGGNAGGQSAVLTVRRLAVGKEVKIIEQLTVGLIMSTVIGPLAFVRALLQVGGKRIRECLCIGIAAMVICIVATTLGTSIPKVLWFLKSDPAHASTSIQVLMDIVGIIVVCLLGVLLVSNAHGE
mmetsp:Transcript_16644/g.35200  ORF Transcript_16644/g.35200 Transcript_16644/m.35200 type:complete len:296 (+) Transcript_16644:100-987(+)